MTTIALTHPKVFATRRLPAFGLIVLLHLSLSIGLVWALTHPMTTLSSGPAPAPAPTPSAVSVAPSQPANSASSAPEASPARLRASDLFRAERQEICERRLILNDEWLTGSALMRAAHHDAYEYALAWDMPDLAAQALRMAQAVDLAAICEP